jgi:tRNA G18 (ribose-2'-O)-methylase SpoU
MIVILDNIRSALNVGSIVRTCDAFGIKEIAICGLTPDTKNPKVLKTSLGAEKGIKFTHFKSTIDAVEEYRGKGLKIVSLELTEDAVSLANALKGDIALVIGNEVSGVAPEVLRISDQIIQIPMKGVKESLNVAVAFGIAAYALSSE